jgi:DNA polymerase III, delta subunit
MENHHALVFIGSLPWARTRIPHAYIHENEDVLHQSGQRMGIDDVRTLVYEAYRTPMNAPFRVFVLAYTDYTHEAQNALLKILEEPPKTARFYILAPHPLLPTLRSRLVVADVEYESEHTEHADFFELSYGERLAHIAQHAQKKDDAWLSSLMESFEEWAHTHRDTQFIHALLELTPLFHTQGASKKMILEHLALILPKAP